MGLSAPLSTAFSVRLRELICAVAKPDGEAGIGTLQAALDDSTVHIMVIAVQLHGEPAASLLQVVRASDALAQWVELSCI